MDIEQLTVHFLTIGAGQAGQRLDNFLFRRYPAVPKSRIYQMLRRGEIRRNGKRCAASDRLELNDMLRLPPLYQQRRAECAVPPFWQETIKKSVVYEDADFLIVNKPRGLAVQRGTAQAYSLIDGVQQLWGDDYRLCHRLDQETSGLLVLGKNNGALRHFQDLQRENRVEKHYLCLCRGDWPAARRRVAIKVKKIQSADGDRMVVSADGKEAITHFQVLERFPGATLLAARLETGRTHQIRLTLRHCGHVLAGDDKYGDREFNKMLRQRGYGAMFLQAYRLTLPLADQRTVAIGLALAPEERALLEQLAINPLL